MCLCGSEVLYAEQLLCICPYALNDEACTGGQLRKFFQGIFVGTLCPDAFSQFKGKRLLSNVHNLMHEAYQVHLDPALSWIIECVMAELIQLKVCIEFLVDAFQQVQVKLGCNTLLVIIGPVQNVEVFLQIHADQ